MGRGWAIRLQHDFDSFAGLRSFEQKKTVGTTEGNEMQPSALWNRFNPAGMNPS